MDNLRAVGYYPLPAFVIAERKGLFTREGIQVDFEIATFAPEHNRGMAEGRWDLSLTSPDAMIARATRDGHDFVLYLMAERDLLTPLNASMMRVSGQKSQPCSRHLHYFKRCLIFSTALLNSSSLTVSTSASCRKIRVAYSLALSNSPVCQLRAKTAIPPS